MARTLTPWLSARRAQRSEPPLHGSSWLRRSSRPSGRRPASSSRSSWTSGGMSSARACRRRCGQRPYQLRARSSESREPRADPLRPRPLRPAADQERAPPPALPGTRSAIVQAAVPVGSLAVGRAPDVDDVGTRAAAAAPDSRLARVEHRARPRRDACLPGGRPQGRSRPRWRCRGRRARSRCRPRPRAGSAWRPRQRGRSSLEPSSDVTLQHGLTLAHCLTRPTRRQPGRRRLQSTASAFRQLTC
jgi:hypothetical protein